ncbi:hypothetical protein [Priestia abyssalis]|uniref:hypothetical protein n=1 Tax=Priestia abyssalis TaxID=1221450 RepID=UPI000995B09F|nr:hypothetical protein [Priestia abyssalis]
MAKIQFHSINVNMIQNSSGLFYGVNLQSKWKNKGRISDGFGRVNGHSNKILNNTSIVKGSGKVSP